MRSKTIRSHDGFTAFASVGRGNTIWMGTSNPRGVCVAEYFTPRRALELGEAIVQMAQEQIAEEKKR